MKLVYDGDCGFCNYTVEYAAAVAPQVEFVPYQIAADQHPEVSREQFVQSIQLFVGDSRYEGAQAALRVLARAPRMRGWWWMYRYVPGVAGISEAAYRWVARHRGVMLTVCRNVIGPQLRPLQYERSITWTKRCVAILLAIACISFAVQASGLVGEHGILPATEYFAAVYQRYGISAFYLLPSLCWFACGSGALAGYALLGVISAVLILSGRLVATAHAIGAMAYLSLVSAGQLFMGYQWDALLVEVCVLLAIAARRQRMGVWLLRLLMFRFMFLSGAVKWLSGDPTWRDGSALQFHFWTQPLPTPLAWYAAQLPEFASAAATYATLVIECVLPFAIFGPRRVRITAAAVFALFELLILLTGNYNFFNLLTLALCIVLLDDRCLPRTLSRARQPQRVWSPWRWRVTFAVLAALSVSVVVLPFAPATWRTALAAPLAWVAPFRIVNSYGVFAVMTTDRIELQIEATLDGETWLPYEFRYKPNDASAPRWATPHQPRLDWQMWFAALGAERDSPWMRQLLLRLLVAEPDVLALFSSAPFGERAPAAVRVTASRFRFSTSEQRAAGEWWQREPLGVWMAPMALKIKAPQQGELMEIP